VRTRDTADRARLLRELHDGPDVLVLPNAWDAGSAVLLAGLPGVRAIGTTSAGLAAAQGLPDGERLPLDQLLAVVGQLTRSVDVPVTVDLESGYGRTAEDVVDSVISLIELGAAGVNVEDGLPAGPGLAPVAAHAERVAAARAAGAETGVPLVVNARTDVFWRSTGEPGDRFDEAVRRLLAYRDAGADCLFLPGFPAADTPPEQLRTRIRELTAALDGAPVNVLAAPHLPPAAELRTLGVRRLSVGSALYRLAMSAALTAGTALLDTGDPAVLAPAADLPYARLAELLSR
jgi:2-methylisocitrate lyase-like PEP mutase family enzyme